MQGIDPQFKNFLRRHAGPRARGCASLTGMEALPEALRTGDSLREVARNCEKILGALAAGFSFDPWVTRLLQKPFPDAAVTNVQHQWVLSRISLIAVLEEQLKWLVKDESPAQIRVCLAHTRDLALAVCTLGIEIGCDLERADREISGQIEKRLQPEWPRTAQWTAKESAYKSDPVNKIAVAAHEFVAVLDYQLQTADSISLARADKTRNFHYETFVIHGTHQVAWAIPAP